MKRILAGVLTLFIAITGMNCYGGFMATRKIYNWNGTLGNKWVKTIVMWALVIIPVYPIASLADIVILNTLEFWTGSNPLAMKAGEVETQLVRRDGKEYQITATKNQFEIREVTQNKLGNPVYLTFRPQEEAWYVTQNGKSLKISEATEANQNEVKLFHPDGRSVAVKL